MNCIKCCCVVYWLEYCELTTGFRNMEIFNDVKNNFSILQSVNVYLEWVQVIEKRIEKWEYRKFLWSFVSINKIEKQSCSYRIWWSQVDFHFKYESLLCDDMKALVEREVDDSKENGHKNVVQVLDNDKEWSFSSNQVKSLALVLSIDGSSWVIEEKVGLRCKWVRRPGRGSYSKFFSYRFYIHSEISQDINRDLRKFGEHI